MVETKRWYLQPVGHDGCGTGGFMKGVTGPDASGCEYDPRKYGHIVYITEADHAKALAAKDAENVLLKRKLAAAQQQIVTLREEIKVLRLHLNPNTQRDLILTGKIPFEPGIIGWPKKTAQSVLDWARKPKEAPMPEQKPEMRKIAEEMISTESACIEWGASAEQSVNLATEALQDVYQRGVSHGHLEVAEQLAVLTAENAALELQLKTVLDREAETQRRHDERLDALTAENAKLKKQATLASSECATEAVAWKGVVAQLEQQVERLTTALQWYAAEQKPNEFYIVEAKSRAFISDMADWGSKARIALAACKQEGEPQP
jgi:hypothetical protein